MGKTAATRRFPAKSFGRRAYDLGEELGYWIDFYSNRIDPEQRWRYDDKKVQIAIDRHEELSELVIKLYAVSSSLYAMSQ